MDCLSVSVLETFLITMTPSFQQAAEETLLQVQNENYQSDYVYLSWLARCYIRNGKAKAAWELYLKMDTSPDSLNLLQLIANDSYKVCLFWLMFMPLSHFIFYTSVMVLQMGSFLYAAKAFDVLERLDADPEYWQGKRGACCGVLQKVIAGEEAKESLRDVLEMLRNTSSPQVAFMKNTIEKWCKNNNVDI